VGETLPPDLPRVFSARLRGQPRDEAAPAKAIVIMRARMIVRACLVRRHLAFRREGAARKAQVKRIVAGKPTHSRWVDALFGSQLDELIRDSGDVDVLFVAGLPG
jgi:hypothetical protein